MAAARGDEPALAAAIDRLLCGYAMVLGYGGIPLIYMGDEIALGTDHTYLNDQGLSDDNRWMHRPVMDWAQAAHRHDPSTVAGRVWNGLSALLRARVACDSLHAATATHVDVAEDAAIVLFVRKHAAGSMVQVYNVSNRVTRLPLHRVTSLVSLPCDAISGRAPRVEDEQIVLAPYAHLWLVSDKASRM
jgi:amylosucrase